jgi:hypothetical protein
VVVINSTPCGENNSGKYSYSGQYHEQIKKPDRKVLSKRKKKEEKKQGTEHIGVVRTKVTRSF